MMKKIVVLISCFICSFLSCKNQQAEIHVISPTEMQTLLQTDQVQLVDVRTPEEFAAGFIANAQNIDFNASSFETDILKLDKTKPVILYCHSGGRSAKSAEKLLKAGFVKIYDLDGGISRWKHEGLPINNN